MKQYWERVQALEENMNRANALIIGTYCSKAIQGRLQEHLKYETKIRYDPIEFLRIVNMLMHDPVWARYPYASADDALMRILNLKQQDGEYLTDYVKRFKQSHDVLKPHISASTILKSTNRLEVTDSLENDQLTVQLIFVK